MTPDTARKIVVATALLGSAAIAYQGRSAGFATTYKRVWGLLLLTAGGAVLSDFAPAIVGPYMGLVLIVFLLNTKGGIGGLFATAGKSISTTGATSG